MTSTLPPADTAAPIEGPVTCEPYTVGDGITVIPGYLPVPGLGVLAAHAFVVDGPEPMLVDAGPGGAQDGFRRALASVVDPVDLRWLWLTHTDPDHTGSLAWLLDAAPRLRLITTYLAAGKLGLQMALPMDRLVWLNPGDAVELNGRRLEALRPPTYDAPETVAVHDHSSATLFAADAFGAVLAAPAADAGDVAPGDLADGMALWSTIDAPWATSADRSRFAATLHAIGRLGARRVLSAHLPPAHGLIDALLGTLGTLPGRTPWAAPGQAVLEQILGAGGPSRR